MTKLLAPVFTTNSNIPPAFQKKALDACKGKRLQVLEAVLNPEWFDKTVAEKCELSGFSRESYYAAFKDDAWLELLVSIRESLYPYKRSQLAARIVGDAMIPIKDAFHHTTDRLGDTQAIPYHASVVKSREQAATILGLQLKQPDISLSKGEHEVIHTFKRASDEVLTEFAETGIWKPEWGEQPWRKG